jgi:ubiquinone biosynthesis protein
LPTSQLRHPSFITRIRNLERMREISEVAVRHGFGYFFERHRLFGLIPRWRRQSTAPPVQRGRHIREMLDELGPTFVKFGQLLSTRPDIVPADIVAELVQLQDHVKPFPFEIAHAVISEDLDLTLERAFESIEKEPLASASIGQVYGAVLPGGQKVIVKVQRPGAARQIRKDIDLLQQFADLVEGRMDLGFSPTAVVQEFARSINRELDYVLEARNAERFAENFRERDDVTIPRIYWRYCSSRILVMERLEGPTLNSAAVAALPLEDKRALATSMADCWFKQIFEDGFFHADPHPANVVYLGEGKVGLLDFGLAGFLRRDDLDEGVRLFLHVMDSDIPGIKRSLKRLGVRWSPSADEVVTQTIEEAFSRYFGRSLANIDVTTLLHQAFDIVYSLRLKLPPRFLLLDKALLTLEGVVTNLYPDLNVFELAGRYTGSLKRDRLDPRVISDRLVRGAAEYAEVLRDYPIQLHDLLEEMRAGELEVKYRHTGLENVIHRLDIITNRLVVALICIALGATSTAVGIMVEGGPHVGGVSAWGIPGFAGSLFFGAWLVWAIIRSGRL